MSLSNYPPGHPTGVSRGQHTKIFECEPCYRLITPEDYDALRLRLQLKHGKEPTCPGCGGSLQVASCTQCDLPATHIDTDRAVNAAEPFCDRHGMR